MLGTAARALGTGIVFLAALVLGFTVHLGVPATQRAVVARVNALLMPVFAGRLTIDRVGGLALTSLAGVDAHMDDPDGKTVIRATGIAGRVSTLALVRSLFSRDIFVAIPQASLASAEVNLDADSAGTLRIAKAFLPRTASTSTTPGPEVHLSMPRVHLGHVAVRGQLAGAPLLDGDVDDADGSLSVSPGNVAIDISRGRWAARGLPGGRGAQGDAAAHLALPSPEGRDLGLRVATRATVGTIALQADATYDGGHLDATVDVASATPEQARALWAAWPLAAPVSLHAAAHGALPRLAVQGHASLGAATLDLSGPVTVVPRLEASLHLDAKGVDARSLAPSSSPPRTDLGASGDLTIVTKPDGALTVQAAMDLASGSVGSMRTPTAAINAQVTRGPDPGGEITANAKVAIHEPGAPTVVTARLAPTKRSMLLSFQVESNAPDLSQVAVLGSVAKGRALAQAEGTVDLGGGVVDARLSIAGEDLEASGATAKAARVQVHATGALSSPALDVQVAGEGVEFWRLQCSSLDASARVGIDRGITLRDVELDTRASDQRAHANARFVRVAGNDVRVEDAVVKGFGAPVEGTLSYEPGRLYVRARSGELDLARIARFVSVSSVHEGRVGLDVDATVGRGVAEGRIDFESVARVVRGVQGRERTRPGHTQGPAGGRPRHRQRRGHRVDRRPVLLRAGRRGGGAVGVFLAASLGCRGREGARGPAEADRAVAPRHRPRPDCERRLRSHRADRPRFDERREPRGRPHGGHDGAARQRRNGIQRVAHRRARSDAPCHRRRRHRGHGARGRRARREGPSRDRRRDIQRGPL